MSALLDINVLIALLDPDHVFHDRAHAWWASQSKSGWASCPLTENGVVRIMSKPAYSRAVTFRPGDLVERLDVFARQSDHKFWPDALSLRDQAHFLRERLHSSRAITDVYLLALAVKHQGFLATFDAAVVAATVVGTTPMNLAVI